MVVYGYVISELQNVNRCVNRCVKGCIKKKKKRKNNFFFK